MDKISPELFHRSLAVFRKATDLSVCIKIFDAQRLESTVLGRSIVNLRQHTSAFCRRVKEGSNPLCIECDLRRVPTLCQKKKQPFIHTCHAGADEVIVPIFVEDRLVAIAYLGQFRRRRTQPDSLPRLTRSQCDDHLAMAQLFRSYLTEQISRPLFSRETARDYRDEAIKTFLRKSLVKNPGLRELARHLGLSTARTAHAVREATGHSFTALRDSIRLSRARTLLETTYYKVAAIAAECGFSSPQYFHRFFQRQMGVTPAQHRRRHRMEA